MTKQGWENKVKIAKRAIGILKKISADSGYDFHFEDLDITLKGKQFTFSGKNLISQELSTFAEEVEKKIIEKDPKKRKGCLWDEGVAQYTTAYNKRMRQALTNLKTKRGIK